MGVNIIIEVFSMEKIRVVLSENLKPKGDMKNLGFGKIFTDHMFLMDYDRARAGMTRE